MTEEKPEPTGVAIEGEVEPKKYFVETRGQKVEIGPSSPTQLAMIRLTANRLARLDPSNISVDEALRVYERSIQIVTGLMVHREDRDWIEDLLLTREMDLEEAAQFMQQALEEWSKDGNREQRRAKKVSRKKTPASKK